MYNSDITVHVGSSPSNRNTALHIPVRPGDLYPHPKFSHQPKQPGEHRTVGELLTRFRGINPSINAEVDLVQQGLNCPFLGVLSPRPDILHTGYKVVVPDIDWQDGGRQQRLPFLLAKC